MRWVRQHSDGVLDAALCAALLISGLPPTLATHHDLGTGSPLGAVLLPTLLIAVPMRRRWPVSACAVYAAACLVSGVPTFDQLRLPIVLPLALVLGFNTGRRAAGWSAVGALALILLGTGIDGVTERVNASLFDELVFAWPLTLGAFGAGRLIRSRDMIAERLRVATASLEARQKDLADIAVEIERARLASDLDAAARRDVMQIEDTASRALVADEDSRAGDEFASIETLARRVLNEMRELLGLLRSDSQKSRAPSPTLDDIDGLIEALRRGGRPVDLRTDGDRVGMPAELELAAYRTLQHALASFEGSSRPVSVVVRFQRDALELAVSGTPTGDDGVIPSALAAARERVRSAGGSLECTRGPVTQSLTARLPVAAGGV